jgi:hypothetical protein
MRIFFDSSPQAVTIARPSADLVTGWTPSTGTALYSLVDETVADDADYISATEPATCDLALSAVTDPGTSSGQVLTIRAKSDNWVAGIPGGSSSLILPRKSYNQPQGRVEIDWSNPASRDLHHVASGIGLRTAYGKDWYSRNGTLIDHVSSAGSGLHFNGGTGVTNNYLGGHTTFPNYFGKVITELTIVCQFTLTAFVTDDERGLFNLGSYDGGGGIYAYIDTSNNLVTSCGHWDSDKIVKSSIALNTPYTLVLSAINQGRSALFVNGGFVGSDASSVYSFNGTSGIAEVGRVWRGIYGGSLVGAISHWQVSTKALHDEVCRSLSANPWQIFKQASTRIPFSTPDIPATPGNTLIATLKQDTTTIATRTITGLTSSYEDHKMVLTPDECDAITDYSSLHVKLDAQ